MLGPERPRRPERKLMPVLKEVQAWLARLGRLSPPEFSSGRRAEGAAETANLHHRPCRAEPRQSLPRSKRSACALHHGRPGAAGSEHCIGGRPPARAVCQQQSAGSRRGSGAEGAIEIEVSVKVMQRAYQTIINDMFSRILSGLRK
jgi:hypothetical protein